MPKSTDSVAASGLPGTNPDDEIHALYTSWRKDWDHCEFLGDLLEVAENAKDEKTAKAIHKLQGFAIARYEAAVDRLSAIAAHSAEGLRTKIAILQATTGIEYEGLVKSVLRDVQHQQPS